MSDECSNIEGGDLGTCEDSFFENNNNNNNNNVNMDEDSNVFYFTVNYTEKGFESVTYTYEDLPSNLLKFYTYMKDSVDDNTLISNIDVPDFDSMFGNLNNTSQGLLQGIYDNSYSYSSKISFEDYQLFYEEERGKEVINWVNNYNGNISDFTEWKLAYFCYY